MVQVKGDGGVRDQVEVVEREWIQDIASCEQSG